MEKYNFVIFQTNSEYYRVSYSDLKEKDDVIYIDRLNSSKSKVLQIIHRIHHSKKANSLIKIPGKGLWYSRYFRNTFKTNRPICFVFNARWMQYNYIHNYVLYLKREYKNAKFVCFYQDLVKTHPEAEPEKISRLFDLMLSYDKGDVQKYSLTYHPTVFSNYPVKNDLNVPESDVYFVGIAKNRFQLILDIFYKLKEARIKCDFYISGVSPGNQVKEEGLHYIDKMNYQDNLKHVIRSKCLLEILQNGATGATVRTWEAIMYNKKILTNNVSIVDDVYYNSEYVSIIQDDEIDLAFLRKENTYNNPYKDLVSPDKLLEFITMEL